MGGTISLQKAPDQAAINAKKAANSKKAFNTAAAKKGMTPANIAGIYDLVDLKKRQWGGKTRKNRSGKKTRKV